MTRAWALVLAVGGCVSFRAPQPPTKISPSVSAPAWDQILFGEPVVRDVSWECPQIATGNYEPGCAEALSIEPICTGVTCTFTHTARFSGGTRLDPYRRTMTFAFHPAEPGKLTIAFDVRDRVGVKRYELGTVELIVLPPAEITCRMRDPATGDYVDCPSSFSADRDLAFEGSYKHDVTLAMFSLAIDGARLLVGGVPQHGIDCRFGDRELAGVIYRDVGKIVCRGRLPAGRHTVSALGNGHELATLKLSVEH